MNKKHGKNAFYFVLVVVFLDMIGFGLIMPVMPELLSELTGKPVSEAVVWAGPIIAIYAVMNFLASPVLGGLSDKYGRRPIILLSVAALGANFLIMGFAQSIWLLVLARMISGIAGATFSTANAYIADVTEPENRPQAFGMIGAAFGFGFIIGPVLGGYLSEIDTRTPFFAAAALSGISLLYGCFIMPESLAKENRRDFNILRANPFGAFKHFSKLPQVYWIMIGGFLISLAHNVYPAVWSYHGTIRYGWSGAEIGNSLGVVGLMAAIVQGGLTGWFTRKFGSQKTAWIGLSFSILAYFGFALAGNAWMAIGVMMFSGLGGLTMPAINSITSSRTPKDSQGELHGATSSLQSLATMISPLIMAQTLYVFSNDNAPVYFPGAPFLLAGILALASIPFILTGMRKTHSNASDQEMVAPALEKENAPSK